VEEAAPEITHEWHFRIGDAFPADDPLARFIVAVGQAMNDTSLANSLFVQSERPYEHVYFFNLASSHLYEAAETFRQAHREWEEVRDFIAALEPVRQEEFASISALADPTAEWPGNRLKELRNSFFHYLRLDRAAAEAGRLPLQAGLAQAADHDGQVIIERGGPLNGIRALFADEVLLNALSADFEEDEFERLAASFGQYQPALNRFAQAAVGRYLRERPEGVVEFHGEEEA
jgi:hypothetical protein